MSRKATITIMLVPESQTTNQKQIKKEIKKTLECAWLMKIQKIRIE